MASKKDLKKRGQAWLTYGALLFVGILVGHAFPSNSATPRSVTGTVSQFASGPGTDFKLKPGNGPAVTYLLSDQTSWQDKPGHWTSAGVPSCLSAGAVRTASSSTGGKAAKAAKPKSITIGVITVPPTNGLNEIDVVVWVRC